jgi:hypothetical protein
VNNPDQLEKLITDLEEMDGLGCRKKESSTKIDGTATLFWYQNSIAVVQYIPGYPMFKDQHSY